MPKTIVISGSFSRHYDEIKKLIAEFEAIGIEVLSPKASKIINPGEKFAILETDDTDDFRVLEQRHLDAISKADAFYLCNPDGYLGDSVKLELGWALASGKPIFCIVPATDVTLKLFSGIAAQPKEVKRILENQPIIDFINQHSSVPALQKYVHDMVIRRGFDKENPQDILLLLMEEVGELAKAMRKYLGFKTGQEKDKQEKYTEVQSELADIFIYLLDISNTLNISLIQAFQEKEKENEMRKWK
jgi:NTP pyrophosphatase (non-canonical NTP hydrolase)